MPKIAVKCVYKKMVDLSELIPNPDNPNVHPPKQIEALANIMKFQGWRLPITVSKRSGFIVRGHGRREAALLLGCKKVPVDFQEYKSDAEEWADLIADNKIAELANLDDGLLKKLIDEIDKDFDFGLTGLSEKDLQKLMEPDKKAEKPEVEFTEELHESSNYIVLYFDNDIDWLQALTLFDLKTVKALDSKPGFEKAGIGRVIKGAEALNKILGE